MGVFRGDGGRARVVGRERRGEGAVDCVGKWLVEVWVREKGWGEGMRYRRGGGFGCP